MIPLPDQFIRPDSMRMEARCIPLLALALVAVLQAPLSAAGRHETPNFIVTAPTPEIAKQVGEVAEYYRRELAIEWLGRELPRWYRPCPVTVKVGQMGAGGATTFTFEGGEVFGWRMNVQGSLERILDSVIPHEVSHTIFACHFRCPLPRWADEGAATLIENESERMRQTRLLDQVIHTNRRIPLQRLLAIKEYPQNPQQVLTLYAEGYSLASFLVQKHGDDGKSIYLKFLADAMNSDWASAFRKHYGYENLQHVERDWTDWVLAGSQPPANDGTMLAANDAREPAGTAPSAEGSPSNTDGESVAASDRQIRGQSPQPLQPLAAINRALRNQPSRRRLSAPDPNVTAMPEFLGAEWSDNAPGDSRSHHPLAPPARTRRADLGGHSTSVRRGSPDPAETADRRSHTLAGRPAVETVAGSGDPPTTTNGSSTAFAATRQSAEAEFPTQRTGDRATWPDERTDGLFSP